MAGLKFRVLLDSKENNEIFRDIIIGDNENFETLYKLILNAYNFSEQQMASFYMSNDNWDKGHEISLIDMSLGEDAQQILPGVMSSSILADFMTESDQKIILVHDFLRMWIFLIELIETSDDAPAKPKILLSVGDAPLENSRSSEDENLVFETDTEEGNEDEDEFGFGEFEDEYDI
jgi:hypothetical protein